MIEKMKRVNLVSLSAHREETLEALRHLEVMHVRLPDFAPSETLSDVQKEVETVSRAVNLLAGAGGEAEGANPFEGMSSKALLAAVLETSAAVAKAQEESEALLRTEELLVPWGDFSVASLEGIRSSGVKVALCTASASKMPDVPAGVALQEVNRLGDQVYFVVLSTSKLPEDLPLAVVPQGQTLSQVRSQQASARERIAQLQNRLAHATRRVGDLKTYGLQISDKEEFLSTLEGMGSQEELAWLSGYVPESRVESLGRAALEHGWALQIEEPDEDDPSVPTLITVPRWLQVSKPLFDFVGITPGYREFDISAWFLIFFSIFFAILVGDAGYGAIFLGLTLMARRKAKGPARVATNLLLLLSGGTILWGFLTGTYFGIPTSKLPGVLSGLDWLTNEKTGRANVQYVCFMIGAVHLTIAHAIKAASVINSRLALSQLGWALIVWGNFFLGSSLVTGRDLPTWIHWLYLSGAVLVLFFSVQTNNPLKAVGSGLGTLLGNLVNSFVDVLSYIRLFAVGMSSYYVAVSFNNMGVGMIEGKEGLLKVAMLLVAALVIVFGHTLNIALCGLSVLVHGIRLNTLEFSGHLGLEWAGTPFRAFAQRFKGE